jgi:hypothetical protein
MRVKVEISRLHQQFSVSERLLNLGQTFKDAIARDILMAALKTNGRFYLLIAVEGAEPKLKSRLPLENWFGECLEVAEPSPLWVQTPKIRSR